ncbi:PREDICTED: inactive peptidyl-prolyl cis-trans isomerase FKBP6-like [Priapulus caudatus]|uniref:peptidylprolyl isomerase n=1 Tax=Priapulus caudatus TaxID=37621 RepID=A0ABM1DY57_PRICU|nr:PREDICTED: inactive peptidyl-prolyl cis-trans isomerase FKBP6-like [Priapulus caudatus]
MRKDEEAQFILLPDVAFGKMGCPPRIAPNARVMFKVRLIDFVDCTASNEYENSTAEEQRNMSFDKREEVVKSHREAGRVMFETGRYTQARKRYRKAIRLLEECRLQDEIEEKRQQELLLKLYLNMSVTSIKIGSFPQGITFARQALELEQDNAKALYQIGKCKMNLADFDEARHNLVRAQKLEPNNDKIKNLLVDLDRREKAYRLDEKNMYQRM